MWQGRPGSSDQITFIYAVEYGRVRVFCREVLGFEQVLDQSGCCIFRVREGAFLGVCRRGEGKGRKVSG